MEKTNITTIEDLARMINEGFTATATKEDLKEVKGDMKAMEGRLTTRLDRIEHILLEEQRRKIENLETRMKKLEDALAI
jgi:BMFP domain-containing protein YqiC